MYRKPSRRDKSPRGVRFEHSGNRIQSRIEWIENPNDILNVWSNKAKINADEESFLEGILLKSLDIDNPFPFVDYAVFCSSLAHSGTSQGNNTKFPARNCHTNPTTTTQQNGPARLRGTGIYDELENVLRHDVRSLPRTPVSKDSVYILSAFQTDGHINKLEETWKTWSGADYILWKCPEKLKLRRITFLKATSDLDPFTFIVLCECEEGLSICDTAREFVERLKDRRCGLVGLYQVERYYIASKSKA